MLQHTYLTNLNKFRPSRLKVRLVINRIYLYGKLIHRRRTNDGVLYVLPWMVVGGGDKVALDTMRGLAKKGVGLHCITTIPSSNEWFPRLRDYCVNALDIGHLALEANRPWFIRQYVKRHRIKAIITSNNIAGYQAAQLIKDSNMPVRIVDVLHGQGGEHEGGGWPYFSVPYARYLDRRIVVTEYLKDYMITHKYATSDTIQVIHNGIDTTPFSKPSSPAQVMIRNKNKFIVLWAGRFSREKHPEVAIQIAHAISKTPYRDAIHFVMAGGGDMRTELVSKIKGYGLSDLVSITAKPYKDPSHYMPYANVLLLTSEMEGLPIVILEAFASKLPVIASAVGGIPEIVENGKNGYLVPYGKAYIKNATARILFMQKHYSGLRAMQNASYATVKDEFSIEKMAQSYSTSLGLQSD